ncbi:MAG: YbaN family protein [Pirellulales bacterium]
MNLLRLFTGPREVAIDVAKSRDSLSIELPDFDRRVGDGTLRQLVERLFRVPCVEAVLVGVPQRSIVVEFDPRQSSTDAALQEMAAALRQSTATGDSWAEGSQLNGASRGATLAMATVRNTHGLTTIKVHRAGHGTLEVELPAIHNRRPLAQALAVQVEGVDGVRRARCVAPQSLMRIAFDELKLTKGRLLASVNRSLTELLDNPESVDTTPPLATGATRLSYLALGGGCLFMSGLGLVLPGLPTVPFVLATSYFFIRSSPRLDRRLRESQLFGQMLRDWDECGGIRPRAKRSAILFSLSLSTVMVLVLQPSLGTFVLICVGTGIGISFILRMPTVHLPEEAPPSRAISLPEAGQRLRLLFWQPTPAIEGTS